MRSGDWGLSLPKETQPESNGTNLRAELLPAEGQDLSSLLMESLQLVFYSLFLPSFHWTMAHLFSLPQIASCLSSTSLLSLLTNHPRLNKQSTPLKMSSIFFFKKMVGFPFSFTRPHFSAWHISPWAIGLFFSHDIPYHTAPVLATPTCHRPRHPCASELLTSELILSNNQSHSSAVTSNPWQVTSPWCLFMPLSMHFTALSWSTFLLYLLPQLSHELLQSNEHLINGTLSQCIFIKKWENFNQLFNCKWSEDMEGPARPTMLEQLSWPGQAEGRISVADGWSWGPSRDAGPLPERHRKGF